MNEAFKVDCFPNARPVSFDVKNSKQIRQSFDAISYSKGLYNLFLKRLSLRYVFVNRNNQIYFNQTKK